MTRVNSIKQTLRRWAGFAAFAVAVCVVAPTTAHAGAFDVFGFGSRAAAVGGAASATAADFTALYYNPAALTLADNTLGGGLMLSFDKVDIHLRPRSSDYDTLDYGDNQPVTLLPTAKLLHPRRDVDDIEDTNGYYVGLTHDLGFDKLRIAFAAYLPAGQVNSTGVHFVDEREQFFSNRLAFEFLGRTTQTQQILFGTAYRFLPFLSLGVAVAAQTVTIANANVLVPDPIHQQTIFITMDNTTSTDSVLHLGALLTPLESLRFALTYRFDGVQHIEVNDETQVMGLEEQNEIIGEPYPLHHQFDMVPIFDPAQLKVGAAWSPWRELNLLADLTWSRWEDFRDNFNQRPDPQFENTFALRGGIEWTALDWLTLRSGVFYEPSPVPAQDGRTNFVDNDRLGLSGGTGFNWMLDETELALDWHIQWQRLEPRTVVKSPDAENPVIDEVDFPITDLKTGDVVNDPNRFETNNPGFPGFSSYGWILAGGISATLIF